MDDCLSKKIFRSPDLFSPVNDSLNWCRLTALNNNDNNNILIVWINSRKANPNIFIVYKSG